MNILQSFTAVEPELTITDLAYRLGLNKSTVHRLTGLLAGRGFLRRDPKTRAYMLGPAIIALNNVVGRQNLSAISLPYMEKLRYQTGETVGLNILVGKQRFCVAQVESLNELRMKLDLGRPLPLHCGAASKVFLATMSAAEIEAIIEQTGLRRVGPGSITNADEFRKQVAEIKRNGYAVSGEERVAGGITLAVPVWGPNKCIAASLSVYGPTSRIDHARLLQWLPAVKKTAAAISWQLGHRENPRNDA